MRSKGFLKPAHRRAPDSESCGGLLQGGLQQSREQHRLGTPEFMQVLQKAEEYLHGHNLDEAALCLRKACEDTAKRFIDHNEVVPNKEFVGLADALRAARNKVLANFPSDLYEKVVRNTPAQHRSLLVASSDDDLVAVQGLDAATRGRLKTNRNRLRKLLTEEQVERLRQIKLIDDILACTERVLNPAAHSGTPPLYEKEIQDALALVCQLETTLTT